MCANYGGYLVGIKVESQIIFEGFNLVVWYRIAIRTCVQIMVVERKTAKFTKFSGYTVINFPSLIAFMLTSEQWCSMDLTWLRLMLLAAKSIINYMYLVPYRSVTRGQA